MAYFQALLNKANGGVHVQTLNLRSGATSFTTSQDKVLGGRTAEGDGAAFSLTFYSANTIKQKLAVEEKRIRPKRKLHGYYDTAGSRVFPGGYGEKNAQAFERESVPAVLKSAFSRAVQAFADGVALTVARGGDPSLLKRIFCEQWHLTEEDLENIPYSDLVGSEAQRLCAAADRAYHGVSSHPSSSGAVQFRLAPLMPTSYGENKPLSWQRVRQLLRAIGVVNINMDGAFMGALTATSQVAAVSFYYDFAMGAIQEYVRAAPWESLVRLKQACVDAFTGDEAFQQSAFSYALGGIDGRLTVEMMEGAMEDYPDEPVPEGISKQFARMNDLKSDNELVALARAVGADLGDRYKEEVRLVGRLMIESQSRHADARDAMREQLEDALEQDVRGEEAGLVRAPLMLVKRFNPRSLASMRRITGALGGELAMGAHSTKPMAPGELRKVGLPQSLTTAQCFRTALYVRLLDPKTYRAQYTILEATPLREASGKRKDRLLNRAIYDHAHIRTAVRNILDATFFHSFRALIVNSTASGIMYGRKAELWKWLTSVAKLDTRVHKPPAGNVDNLVANLADSEVWWVVAYYVRMTVGTLHQTACAGMLAPLQTEKEVSLSRCLLLGAKDRLARWRQKYEAKAAQVKLSLNTEGDYKKLVRAQFKAKYFALSMAEQLGDSIMVSIKPASLVGLLRECYQSRHDSLERRLEKYGKIKLGEHVSEEHPWPETLDFEGLDPEGVITMLEKLDPEMWTEKPRDLYTSAQRALSELVADVRAEMGTICELATQMQEADLEGDTTLIAKFYGHHIASTLNLPPHVPPTVVELGRPPPPPPSGSHPPPRQPAEPKVAVDTEAEHEQMLGNLKMLRGLKSSEERRRMQSDLLSLRQIWAQLKLRACPDIVMRFAFGASQDEDLDAPYGGTGIGPIVLVENAEMAWRAWKHQLPMMKHRMGDTEVQTMRSDLA